MTNSKKFALISTVTLVAVLILCALAVFFIPAVGKIVSGGCSAVKTESPQAVALFVNLKAQRSPLAITALALLPALIPGMPLRGLLESAQSMFGPVAGTIFVWAGLFIGLLLGGALGYLLVGQHLKRKRASKDVQTTSPSKAHMLVYYGSRIFPYFPQGIVAFVSGAFVPRCRGALAGAFLASSMIIVNALAPQPFVFYGFAALGCALMGVALYLKRDSLATNNVLTPERKKTLAIASAVIVACAAVYLAVPGVKDSIQNAVRVTMGNPAGVAAYLRGFGIIGPIVSFSLMVLQSVAAPLPAFVITFANGMIWGWALGALLSWSSAMAGAALCFGSHAGLVDLLSRNLRAVLLRLKYLISSLKSLAIKQCSLHVFYRLSHSILLATEQALPQWAFGSFSGQQGLGNFPLRSCTLISLQWAEPRLR